MVTVRRTSTEAAAVELKETYNPNNPADRLHLVKEIVAMANAEGGTILIGVADDGAARPGIDAATVAALDPARLTDLVDRHVAPDHLELSVVHESADRADASVVAIRVPAFSDPPLVLARKGEYQDGKGKPYVVFRQHAVLRRKGTKAEPASRQDYRDWTRAAVAAESELWRSRVALVSNLPPGAVLEVRPAGAEGVEETGSLLRRAVAQYRGDPTKLLSGHDLLAAFVSRAGMTFGTDAYELLIESALRRRPTLFLWLTLAEPTAEAVRRMLWIAIGGRDRDKSDAGRSIVEVAALYLIDPEFNEIIEGLAASRYAHFREAAQAGDDRAAVVSRLDAVHALLLDGAELGAQSDQHLFDQADQLAGSLLEQHNNGTGRKLGAIGTELLLRRRSRGTE